MTTTIDASQLMQRILRLPDDEVTALLEKLDLVPPKDKGKRGHPRFFELLKELAAIHETKNAGYSGRHNADPLANFRLAERFGVTPFRGCMIRLSDKFARAANLVMDPRNEQVNESLVDTLKDLAGYCLIAICLYEEEHGRHDQIAGV